MNKNPNNSGGVDICGLLGIVFVILKLTDVIDWSWWWVTAPFWAPTVIAIGSILVFFVVMGIIALAVWVSEVIKA